MDNLDAVDKVDEVIAMKKVFTKTFLLAAIGLFVMALTTHRAEAQFGQITYGTAPLVGTCGGSPQFGIDVTNNVLYTCGQSGVWVRYSRTLSCTAASNSPSAYTCTTAITPALGDAVLFTADVANNGPATLAINNTSPAQIKKNGGASQLAANDLSAGQITVLFFDGTNFQLQAPFAGYTILTNGTPVAPGQSQQQTPLTIQGLTKNSSCMVSFQAPPPSSWQNGIDILPPVVTTNTVTVWLQNASSNLVSPAAIALTVKCVF